MLYEKIIEEALRHKHDIAIEKHRSFRTLHITILTWCMCNYLQENMIRKIILLRSIASAFSCRINDSINLRVKTPYLDVITQHRTETETSLLSKQSIGICIRKILKQGARKINILITPLSRQQRLQWISRKYSVFVNHI